MIDDEKLIILVRENDVLYNKRNRLYKYPDKKREVWQEIAAEMGVNEKGCNRRWTSLRDRYSRECRKLENEEGYKTVWPYMEIMEFLKPHITPRPERQSYRVRECISETVDIQTIPLQLPIESPRSCAAYELCDGSTNTSISQSSEANSNPFVPSVLRVDKKQKQEIDNSLQGALESLKSACDRNKLKQQNPSVYAFGQMIMSTICSMNTRNQIRAMQQATDIVMTIKLEERDLIEQVNYATD